MEMLNKDNGMKTNSKLVRMYNKLTVAYIKGLP